MSVYLAADGGKEMSNMRLTATCRFVNALFILSLFWSYPAQGVDPQYILGVPPTYTTKPITTVPNAQAIRRAIWVPNIDRGFVPQGLTTAQGQVLLTGYRGIERNQGPSTVFRIAPSTGTVTGRFRLPDDIQHPGGLAYAGQNILYVANSGTLTKVDLKVAFRDGHTDNAIRGQAAVDFELGPSYLAYDGTHLWFGKYRRSGDANIYRLNPDDVFGATPAYLDAQSGLFSFAVALRTQGASFDRQGHLWLSQSSGSFGRLQQIDPKTGQVLASYAMPDGIEDLSFFPDGTLWAASEAGARRYHSWATFFPVIFQLELTKLVP